MNTRVSVDSMERGQVPTFPVASTLGWDTPRMGQQAGGIALVVGLVVTALATGCGGSSGAASATSTRSRTTSPVPTTSVATLPPSGPLPTELRGSWTDVENPQLVVTFRAHSYEVRAGFDHVIGDTSYRGRSIFMFVGRCSSGLGHYRWRIEHRRLTLQQIGHDPCANRSSALTRRTFKPASP